MNNNLTTLKIIAIFTIFVSGGFGAIIPNLLNTQKKYIGLILLLCKIFSAGIVLGTGFIHLLADSEDCFNSVLGDSHYPYTGFIAGLACVILMMIEQLINRAFTKQNNNHDIITNHGHDNIINHDHHHNFSYGSTEEGFLDLKLDTKSHEKYNSELKNNNLDHDHNHAHTHDNVSNLNNSIDLKSNINLDDNELKIRTGHCHQINILHEDSVNLKKLITVYILELGIAIHSIMIGITMGTNNDEGSFISLLIALIFHQFFEGIALGASISKAKILNIQKIIMMILFYSLTTPFGIAIGLLINNTYNTNSNESLLIQGIFDALSGGILIYMALIHLIIEDFNNNEINFNIKIGMFLFLLIGFGITSLIAVWA